MLYLIMSRGQNKKGGSMTVLSLFDGIFCGRIALERAGIKVYNYYASEIKKVLLDAHMKTIQILFI